MTSASLRRRRNCRRRRCATTSRSRSRTGGRRRCRCCRHRRRHDGRWRDRSPPACERPRRAVTYLRRASPLHAARAAVASGWCVVLAIVALSFDHPLVLGVLLAGGVAAAAAARVGRRVVRALLFALPFAIVIALLEALVARE